MKYMKPLQLFKQLLRTKASESGRLLCLNVYDDFVSLAVSTPDNHSAMPLRPMLMTWLPIVLLSWLIFKANALHTVTCNDTCGNLSIDYPFGMSEGCYFNESFKVTCNKSSGVEKAYLSRVNHLQLLSVSYLARTEYKDYAVRVNVPVISSNCGNNRSQTGGINLTGSPFTFSATDNRFTAVGCDNFALMIKEHNSIVGGCLSTCSSEPVTKSITGSVCYGLNCCQTTIPPALQFFNASITNRPVNCDPHHEECRSAFMVDQDWFVTNYQKNSSAFKEIESVPAVLDWGRDIGSCYEQIDSSSSVTITGSSGPMIKLGGRYLCDCSDSSFSNATRLCEGRLICLNSPNGDSCSTCPNGYHTTTYGECSNYNGHSIVQKKRIKIIVASCTSAVAMIFLLLIGAWSLCKFLTKRQETKLKNKFFERNGGLLLQQQTFSNDGNIERTKLFTSKELEKATDNYNGNRILGQGGQGTVFKGMLTDGRIVAVKKSKIMDESNVEQFINEVVILSQINHRNVVKLLGCCLETEVPLLVYEFIPNGALSQYINDRNEEFPFTWKMRLCIAVEAADAIAYMHSAASLPIYHRDIKSTNILLDDKYRAKVSDFGCSRSIMIDQTHLTTQVKGTFGYFDPEYFRSSQFTEKSDVYSFGVVLVELLTGQKPIHSTNPDEYRSLASYFIHAMEENHLFEVLDARLLEEGGNEEIVTFAEIAKRCLQYNGKKRPTMREVASELANIKSSNGGFNLHPNYDDIEYIDGDKAEHFETNNSSFTGSSLDCSETLP